MNQKMRKQLKRVIPVTLAVIVLAGFIFGAVGMMVAYAEGETWISETKSSVIFKDAEGSVIRKVISSGRYIAELKIVLSKGDGANQYADWIKENDPRDFMKVTMEAGNFVIASSAGGANNYTFSLEGTPEGPNPDGEYTFIYTLESVRPYYKDSPHMDISVSFLDGTKQQSFTKLIKNITYEGENYRSRPVADDNSSSSSSDSYTYDDDDSSDSKTTSSEDENAIPTPKMIISSFDIPSEVAYGEEFDATIEFYNNSAYKDMVNVTMTVTPSEGVIIRNGVNQRHYIKVPKRQSTTERFRFKASDKLATESITLTVKFEYEYRFNKEYKQGSHEEVLSLVAKPKPEESSSSEEDKTGTEGSISSFELLSIVVPDKVYPDEDAYITIRAINKDHQFDASNVQVTVTGDGLLNSGNTVYHGALAHSTQAEIETTLQFASPGTYPLVCTLVYEDSVGLDEDKKPIVRINDIQKDFTVTVLESPYADMGNMGDMGDMGDMGMDPGMDGAVPAQGGAVEWMRGHLWAPIGGGIVLLAVIAGVVRHIRRKKAADDDDL